ncbi:GNAT family N-acetyltransferase [Halobacteriales archaeon QS_4_70_19]|nr:MAG: GNAT family N-acetyltransferase [Halobacteriales archaeon QS_4_70_19]
MQVREATPADESAIRSIAKRSMEASYSLSPGAIEEAIVRWYSSETFTERLEDDDVLYGDVNWLHVDPMHRGEGIGEDLFNETRKALRNHGAETIRGRVLSDNTEGNKFYERQGLVKSGEGKVDLDGPTFVENVYTDAETDDLEATATPDGTEVFVDHLDTDRGSKGAFHVVYTDEEREDKWGFFCGNCDSFITSMDTMGRMECDACGNQRKPTRWDAAYM